MRRFRETREDRGCRYQRRAGQLRLAKAWARYYAEHADTLDGLKQDLLAALRIFHIHKENA